MMSIYKNVSTLKQITLVLMMSAVAVCAKADVFTWQEHNLTFAVPDGGFVVASSTSFFEIHWNEMAMTVQLYEKTSNFNKKKLPEDLKRRALDYSMYDIKQGKIKVKGFDGYYASGTMPDGTRGYIAHLASKKTKIVAVVTINYLMGDREIVDDIIKSFAENKQLKPNHEKPKQKVQTKRDADKQKPQPKPNQPRPQAKPKSNEKVFEI